MRYELVRSSFPVPDESSATLASYFMQHVLMKVGLCHLVVLDNLTPFKGDYIAICQALNLNYDILLNRIIRGSLLSIKIASNIKV